MQEWGSGSLGAPLFWRCLTLLRGKPPPSPELPWFRLNLTLKGARGAAVGLAQGWGWMLPAGQSCRMVVTEGKRGKRELEGVRHKELGSRGGSESCQSLAGSLSDNLWQVQGSSWSPGSLLLTVFGKQKLCGVLVLLSLSDFRHAVPKLREGTASV